MASRMVFSSNEGSVCGFAGSELPITVYPGGHTATSNISINWSLSLESAERLAADLLAAVTAVKSAPQIAACARCGSSSGVQIDTPLNKGCTHCMDRGGEVRS